MEVVQIHAPYVEPQSFRGKFQTQKNNRADRWGNNGHTISRRSYTSNADTWQVGSKWQQTKSSNNQVNCTDQYQYQPQSRSSFYALQEPKQNLGGTKFENPIETHLQEFALTDCANSMTKTFLTREMNPIEGGEKVKKSK